MIDVRDMKCVCMFSFLSPIINKPPDEENILTICKVLLGHWNFFNKFKRIIPKYTPRNIVAIQYSLVSEYVLRTANG